MHHVVACGEVGERVVSVGVRDVEVHQGGERGIGVELYANASDALFIQVCNAVVVVAARTVVEPHQVAELVGDLLKDKVNVEVGVGVRVRARGRQGIGVGRVGGVIERRAVVRQDDVVRAGDESRLWLPIVVKVLVVGGIR